MTVNARRRPRIERGLAIAAIVGGALAVVAGTPTRPTRGSVDVTELARIVEHEEDHVTAVELAKWIRDDKAGLRVLDIRSDSEFSEFHIPGAKRVPLGEIARMPLDSAATYVLYSEGGTHAAQGWFLLRARGTRERVLPARRIVRVARAGDEPARAHPPRRRSSVIRFAR